MLMVPLMAHAGADLASFACWCMRLVEVGLVGRCVGLCLAQKSEERCCTHLSTTQQPEHDDSWLLVGMACHFLHRLYVPCRHGQMRAAQQGHRQA